MKASEFRQIIAELANITKPEQDAKAYSVECKLQASAYRFEISVKEYSELLDEICRICRKGVS